MIEVDGSSISRRAWSHKSEGKLSKLR
jgi:hypothetical protein